jgi:hypothetical protein
MMPGDKWTYLFLLDNSDGLWLGEFGMCAGEGLMTLREYGSDFLLVIHCMYVLGCLSGRIFKLIIIEKL